MKPSFKNNKLQSIKHSKAGFPGEDQKQRKLKAIRDEVQTTKVVWFSLIAAAKITPGNFPLKSVKFTIQTTFLVGEDPCLFGKFPIKTIKYKRANAQTQK